MSYSGQFLRKKKKLDKIMESHQDISSKKHKVSLNHNSNPTISPSPCKSGIGEEQTESIQSTDMTSTNDPTKSICTNCNIEFEDITLYNQHIASIAHKKQVSKQKLLKITELLQQGVPDISIDTNGNQYCKCCRKTISAQVGAYGHLNSKHHQRMKEDKQKRHEEIDNNFMFEDSDEEVDQSDSCEQSDTD